MCSFLVSMSDDPVQFMAIEDRFGRTPLEDAVVGKQHEVVVLLRGMGATMRSTEELGYVLLHSASTGDSYEVQRLLESGIDANMVDYGYVRFRCHSLHRRAFTHHPQRTVVNSLVSHTRFPGSFPLPPQMLEALCTWVLWRVTSK